MEDSIMSADAVCLDTICLVEIFDSLTAESIFDAAENLGLSLDGPEVSLACDAFDYLMMHCPPMRDKSRYFHQACEKVIDMLQLGANRSTWAVLFE